MNLTVLSDILLILVAVGVIAVRQMTWRPVLGGRDWLFPALAAVVGAALSVQSLNGGALGLIDVVAFVIEIVISLAVGAGMGAIAHIRPIARTAGAPAPGASAKAIALAAAEFETRTGAWGLALWVVLIGARVGLSFAFASFGSHLGISGGLILLVLAANRAARILVLHNRVLRRAQEPEGRRTAARGGSARIMVP
ncbi:hypothetical protein [Microbacterium capsulatum]|uniref:DUF1453 domain-containing protein n=1 Tax=Microbacterium capsulatum TaxID=3041921 RepID=A0ABU0XIF4_9MICO|nr:hypothetical protein [Microbacterium sp. ASV81]MDQ4214916.1 hypothetical protein [Microbacterium sp. ASV81]